MVRQTAIVIAFALVLAGAKQKEAPPSELDRFVSQATAGQASPGAQSPGSLYTPGANMLDLASDIRARRVNDVLTIVVLDRASAVARGTTKTARSSAAQASITSIAGTPPGGDRLTNLLKLGGNSTLDGQGETSRETVLNTTLTARVTQVLPNGLLVVEGVKSVRVNSEVQQIGIRGVVRPVDLSTNNRVFSDNLAFLEINVNGKGVVGDAVRRPNLLYRLLLGILPF